MMTPSFVAIHSRLASERGATPMVHPWHDVTPGEHLPHQFNSLVEIPMGSSIKYELDKKTGPKTTIRSTSWSCARSRWLR
jgi:hypothetical protein